MTSSYPEFFIIFLPEQHSQRMIIPNAFLELTCLQESLPEDIILRDHRSGRVWHVKARRIDEKLCLEFDDGWKQFREENHLMAADFLIFTYNGSNEFRFKIFDLSSGCERMKVKEEEEHERDKDYMMVLEEHEDKDSKMEEEEEEDDDEESEDDSYDYDDDDDDDYFDDTQMEEENEEEYSGNMRSKCHYRASKVPVMPKRGTARSSTSKVEDFELEDCEYDAEMYVHPDNPYFVAKTRKHRPNELHIPRTIIKEFSLSFPEKITLLFCKCQNIPRNEVEAYHLNLRQQSLICSKRMEGTGLVCTWKDGRVCVRGWERFSQKNRIKENDACICEVVLGENQETKMLLVHVFHA